MEYPFALFFGGGVLFLMYLLVSYASWVQMRLPAVGITCILSTLLAFSLFH